ncbi:MAG: hypothetical protein JSS83_28255 [Cyanobacteria bacterium SZAS LIN-3]|nr:hypothetical protein [Cyanobacteria bacterium SZAS LIN-3]
MSHIATTTGDCHYQSQPHRLFDIAGNERDYQSDKNPGADGSIFSMRVRWLTIDRKDESRVNYQPLISGGYDYFAFFPA